jgi:hypothetical protein
MITWVKEKDGKIGGICTTKDDVQPGSQWRIVPNDFGGNTGDPVAWFDETGRRIPDAKLVETGKRKDNRGRWYHTERPGETKLVYQLDEESPGDEWTRAEPLENEPYQKWDKQNKRWVIDAEAKTKAEKDQEIAGIQSQIELYESKLQRPLIALANPGITKEQETEERSYYNEYADRIRELREEKAALLSA